MAPTYIQESYSYLHTHAETISFSFLVLFSLQKINKFLSFFFSFLGFIYGGGRSGWQSENLAEIFFFPSLLIFSDDKHGRSFVCSFSFSLSIQYSMGGWPKTHLTDWP